MITRIALGVCAGWTVLSLGVLAYTALAKKKEEKPDEPPPRVSPDRSVVHHKGAVVLQHDRAIARVPVASNHARMVPDLGALYKKKYTFSRDMFSSSLEAWKPVLMPFAGKPNLHYLEVGVFEGSSFFWMLEQILTHPTARAVAVDAFFNFKENYEKLFRDNLALYGHEEKVRVIKALSGDALRELEPDTYDIIYVDGSHNAKHVIEDAVNAWRLLKNGGVIIFDDYRIETVYHAMPSALAPTVAIDAFITANRDDLEVVHRGYQMIVRKNTLEHLLESKGYLEGELALCSFQCLRIGNHVYDWHRNVLYNMDSGEKVEINRDEATVVRALLSNRRFGAGFNELDPDDLQALSELPGYERMAKVLGL